MPDDTAPSGDDQDLESIAPPAGDTESAPKQGKEQPPAETPPPEAAEETEELLSSEERQRIVTTPELKKAYKELQKAFTQKRQRDSDQIRQMQAALADPLIVSQLAQRVGLRLAEGPAATTQQVKDEAYTTLEEAFGAEWATKLIPAFEKLVAKAIEPLRRSQDSALGEIALGQTTAALEALSERHPDWPSIEEEMTELSQRLQPSGIDEDEYVELLYNQVMLSKGSFEADTTKRVLTRVNASAAASESRSRTLSPSKIAKTPPATAREAVEMALRGERAE